MSGHLSTPVPSSSGSGNKSSRSLWGLECSFLPVSPENKFLDVADVDLLSDVININCHICYIIRPTSNKNHYRLICKEIPNELSLTITCMIKAHNGLTKGVQSYKNIKINLLCCLSNLL